MQLQRLALVFFATLAVTLTGWAHHSHGNYEMTQYTELDGTVTDLYFINPHAWLYMDVETEAGETVTWAMEAAGASTLTRAGISEDDLALGDRIHVKCHALRDGSPGCLLGFVTTPDGVVKEWD